MPGITNQTPKLSGQIRKQVKLFDSLKFRVVRHNLTSLVLVEMAHNKYAASVWDGVSRTIHKLHHHYIFLVSK